MRIAIDCRYIRERPSGIGCYVEALVERLPSLAPKDEFFLWTHRYAPRPLSLAANVSEHMVAVEPNSLGPILWPQRYASFACVDLFHAAHNILPRNLPCPSVVTIHDTFAIESTNLSDRSWNDFIKSFYYPRAVWRALRRATRLITTTNAMAEIVSNLHPPARKRIAVIPLAAGPEFVPPRDVECARERAAKIIDLEAPYFLVVGQNNRRKQQRVALEAFATAAPSSWRLVLVQRQDSGGPLRQLASRLQIEERIVWLGPVKTDELIALYQSAGALIQPSLYEGFGLPVLEAMACGCPVIASDLPTLREVAKDAAVFVAPNDVTAFARAMRELALSGRSRAALSHAAAARAATFSWGRCAEATLEVYRDAVGAR
ncbi:MAG: glycosyltransferase family 4 protein [Chthoniobacterales bacterium]